jgi:hypothetical protein
MASTRRERDAAYTAELLRAQTELDPALDRWIVHVLHTLAGDYDFFRPEVEPLFTVRDWLSLARVRGIRTRAGALLSILIWRNFCFSDFRSIVRGDKPYKFIELLDLHFWHRLEEDGGVAVAANLNHGYWKRAYFWSRQYVHTRMRAIVEVLFKDLDMEVGNEDEWPDEIDMGPQTPEQKHDFAPLALPTTIPGSIDRLEQFLVPFATTGIKIGGRSAGAALNLTFPTWEVEDENDLGRIGFDPLVTSTDASITPWTLSFVRAEADEDASALEIKGGGPLRLREWTWSGMPGREGSYAATVALGGVQAREPDADFMEQMSVYAIMHAIDMEAMFLAIGGLMLDADERVRFDEPDLARYNAAEYDDHFRAMTLGITGKEYFELELEPSMRFECFAMAPDYEFLLALPDAGWLVAFDGIMREPASDAGRERDPLRRDGKLVFYKCTICASADAVYADLNSTHMYCDRCRREAHST